jgi:hypothetical protein
MFKNLFISLLSFNLVISFHQSTTFKSSFTDILDQKPNNDGLSEE